MKTVDTFQYTGDYLFICTLLLPIYLGKTDTSANTFYTGTLSFITQCHFLACQSQSAQ